MFFKNQNQNCPRSILNFAAAPNLAIIGLFSIACNVF